MRLPGRWAPGPPGDGRSARRRGAPSRRCWRASAQERRSARQPTSVPRCRIVAGGVARAAGRTNAERPADPLAPGAWAATVAAAWRGPPAIRRLATAIAATACSASSAAGGKPAAKRRRRRRRRGERIAVDRPAPIQRRSVYRIGRRSQRGSRRRRWERASGAPFPPSGAGPRSRYSLSTSRSGAWTGDDPRASSRRW
jgi:hypothetical protein